MGVAYLIDKQPMFITFKKYSMVLAKMRNYGLTSLDEEYSAEFDNESHNDLEEKIISFIRDNKNLINSGKFDLEGTEAQEEISTLLDAYRWAYGGFDFYRLTNPFGGFVPFAYAGIDIRYPYGKRFFISRITPKRLFNKREEPQIHILIETEKVTHIKGDLSSFEIIFTDDRRMIFYENQFCVI